MKYEDLINQAKDETFDNPPPPKPKRFIVKRKNIIAAQRISA